MIDHTIRNWADAHDFANEEARRAYEAMRAGDCVMALVLNQSAREANALASRLFQQALSA